jgi:hypothetical protein
MSPPHHRQILAALFGMLLAAAASTAMAASYAEEYNARAAQRDAEAFGALDVDRNGVLSLEEVRGNVDMQARFNDFDINRDGGITVEELERYVLLRYGVAVRPR